MCLVVFCAFVCSCVAEYRIFFTSVHDIKQTLVEVIDHETRFIKVAMYMFTDKTIAQALCAARMRGVEVEVIVDQASLSHALWRHRILQEAGISCYGFMTQGFSAMQDPLMHHKFMLCGNNSWCNGVYRTILITGSANWSGKVLSGKNWENVVIGIGEQSFFQYQQEFMRLKQCKQVVKLV